MLGELVGGLLPGFAVALLVFVIGIFIFGGGALLWVGAKYASKIPNATYWKCVGAYLLACLVGSVIPVLGLIVGWLVIKAILDTTFGKAVLAWLPTLALGVVAVPLMVAILMPALAQAREFARQAVCKGNASSICSAIAMYTASNGDQWPPDLDSLLRDPETAKYCVPRTRRGGGSVFACPSCPTPPGAGKFDYFYLPTTSSADPGTIVLCDYGRNHKGGYRTILYQDLHVGEVRTDEEFRQMLALPVNAKFAEALRKAEGTQGPERP